MICSNELRNSRHTCVVIKAIVAMIFLVAAFILFFGSKRKDAAFAQNLQSVTSASKPEMASHNDDLVKKTEKSNLLREGTIMQSQHVIFRVSNDRIILSLDTGAERYVCLENLNLQRITAVLKSNPTLTDWTVDFVVTEYQGSNYVLIQRAVLSSTSQRSSDQKVEVFPNSQKKTLLPRDSATSLGSPEF